jgi:pyrroloquinoline quinone biosynthesis protein B
VLDDLSQGNPVLRVLGHFCGVQRQAIALDGTPFTVPGVAGLRFGALPLRSKAAPYSPHRDNPVPGDNIGILVNDSASGKRLFYAPGLGEITPDVFEAMASADAVMVDGTFWTDDEMVALGISAKTARSIGHLAQSGPGGMVEWLGRLPARTRKLLIHINNTNPILDEDSPQRAALTEAGIEVCEDRMEILL